MTTTESELNQLGFAFWGFTNEVENQLSALRLRMDALEKSTSQRAVSTQVGAQNMEKTRRQIDQDLCKLMGFIEKLERHYPLLAGSGGNSHD